MMEAVEQGRLVVAVPRVPVPLLQQIKGGEVRLLCGLALVMCLSYRSSRPVMILQG